MGGLFLIGGSVFLLFDTLPSFEQMVDLFFLKRLGLLRSGSIPLAYAFILVALARLVGFLRHNSNKKEQGSR